MTNTSTSRVAAPTAPHKYSRFRKAAVFRQLGPGLVTGAADDDPSDIATYSQAGAQFGFNMLWTMVFTYPLMTAVQLVSARIGPVTGAGLANNISTGRRALCSDLSVSCLSQIQSTSERTSPQLTLPPSFIQL